MIPIADRNPTRRTPWVTRALVIANVVVFVLLTPWAAQSCEQVAFFQRWAAVPAEILGGQPLGPGQLEGTAAEACGLTPATGKDVLASVLTSMFLHAGWIHLLLNMLYLWIFGNNVEDRMGHIGFLGFYLLCGAAATVVFAVANAGSTTSLVGASGAIAGVLGAYFVLFPRARVFASVPVLFFLVIPLPAWLVLALWFVGQVGALRVGDMAGTGVAYLAHVAGFVVGLALVVVLGIHRTVPPSPARRRPPRSRTRRRPRRRRSRRRRDRWDSW